MKQIISQPKRRVLYKNDKNGRCFTRESDTAVYCTFLVNIFLSAFRAGHFTHVNSVIFQWRKRVKAGRKDRLK